MNIEINFLKNFIILASGGINLQNLSELAKYCNSVITSAAYHAKPANVEIKFFKMLFKIKSVFNVLAFLSVYS